ncbi:hypothetical protein KXS07_35165 [Inquilinus limosus]|uniref:hypothetical protein n=1 Tax=Inquilinus limosus TaxID=171674 RepID=UPI0003F8AB16|nr:hypothetical protein [Inquilinus limosus]
MTAIAKPETSLLSDMAPEEQERLRSIAEDVRSGANWVVRKRKLLDTLLAIEAAIGGIPNEALIGEDSDFAALRDEIRKMEEAAQAAAVAAGEAPEAPLDEEELAAAANEIAFLTGLPTYVGAVLEILDEGQITTVEQAAFYHLSAHPEHQRAADAWFDEDIRNDKAFRKFLRANRDYSDLLDRFEEMLDVVEEGSEDGDFDESEVTRH